MLLAAPVLNAATEWECAPSLSVNVSVVPKFATVMPEPGPTGNRLRVELGRLDPLECEKMSMMDRSARILGTIAVTLMLLAWCRIGWTTLTTASPAHEMRFVDPSGAAIAQWDVHCHGPMMVRQRDAWQMCARTEGEREVDHLAHFDLQQRVVTLLQSPSPETNLRAVTAAIPHPDGGLLILAEDELLHVTRSAVTSVERWQSYSPNCLRLDERTLEVASFFGGSRPLLARLPLDGGDWTRTEGDEHPGFAAPGVAGAACRWTDAGWVFAWTKTPLDHSGDGPVTVDVLEAPMNGAPKVVETFSFDPEHSRRVSVTPAGHVMLESPLLDPMQSFGLPRSWGAQPPLEFRDGHWVEPDYPEGSRSVLVGMDHIVADTRVHSVINFESPPFLRVEGRWVRVEKDDDRDVVLYPEDSDGTDPITGMFWMSVGLKLFPDPDGGYWMMGGLGEAVVHLDADFERSDGLGLFGRLARAFRDDRSKHNSDFYSGLAWFHRFGLAWTLFGGLLVVAPLVRKRGDTVRIAAVIYLLGVVIGGYSFWKLSGVFW